MGCQTDVNIGDTFVFSVTTHDPDTGILTNADFDPVYWIYEEETGVAILNGNMTALNPVVTTGFYTEAVDATLANGFENRLTYTIYIEGTVNAKTGGICYGIRATTYLAPSTGINFPYRVLNEATGNPIDGVQVWFATDTGGTNVVWTGYTDAFGYAHDTHGNNPILDAGTYYVFRQLAGYTFPVYDTEVVA